MPTAIAEIIEWVKELKLWEQAAFELIISGKEISQSDIDSLVKYLLEENNLVDMEEKYPQLKFYDFQLTNEDHAPYRLRKISNLRNINALVSGQTLEFGDHLTAIFGVNGSGKSGYARVLGSAGFTRGDQQIIPDITKPFDPNAPQLVDIELQSDDKTISTDDKPISIEHKIGSPCPQLSSFYIFDSTSVIVHLTKKNTVSFSPTGLSHLRNLANLTDKVREELSRQIDERRRPNIYEPLFQGESEVKQLISSLNHETDIASLKALAELSLADEETLKTLKQRITTIETQGIAKKIEGLEQNKQDLAELILRLREVSESLSEKAIELINKDVRSFNTHLVAANILGLENFRSGKLRSIGKNEWIDFISSAKSLSVMESDNDKHSYPQEDSYCLLCQQPLSKEAKELIIRLWSYLESEAQKQLRIAEQEVDNRASELLNLSSTFYDDQLAVSRFILDRNLELHKAIKGYRDACVTMRKKIIENIDARQETKHIEIEDKVISLVAKLAIQIDNEIAEWHKEENELEVLQNRLLELEHRRLLSKPLPQIESYVQDLKWIREASKIGGNTKHITQKYNQLFKKLVTDEYIKLFEDTLKNLGRPLKVHIETVASKSEVYKQLVLEAAENTPAGLINPDKILSEGEKRAVALADFLTEIALDTSSRGIILDDPVTSLDLAWRQKIAEVLVEEAKKRQVIVFTHDMPFLYFLREVGEKRDVPIDNHWITRGALDGLPGYVSLNNSPALEQDYKNDVKARACYEKAKGMQPEEQLAMVRYGFGVLRTSYEVLIMYELFNGVVKRFEEQTSFMNLRHVGWDNTLVDTIVEKCELCSRLMEGHSHSDAYVAELPAPSYLFKEIEEYNEIRKRVKALRR
jgi:ABC-type Na+ transport system ATPase subunit NatA